MVEIEQWLHHVIQGTSNVLSPVISILANVVVACLSKVQRKRQRNGDGVILENRHAATFPGSSRRVEKNIFCLQVWQHAKSK